MLQLAHGERFLIVASSTVPLSSTDASFPRDSVVQNVPVYASTTFHLVSPYPTILPVTLDARAVWLQICLENE